MTLQERALRSIDGLLARVGRIRAIHNILMYEAMDHINALLHAHDDHGGECEECRPAYDAARAFVERNKETL